MTIPNLGGPGAKRATQSQERSTRRRRTIRSVFDSAERPLSIEEVLDAATRGRNTVSLSAVYRFVRALVKDGSLSVFELPGPGAFYELAGKSQHHHFSRIGCGRVCDLNDCVSVDMLAFPKNFQVLSHELTVAGVCAACSVRCSRKGAA